MNWKNCAAKGTFGPTPSETGRKNLEEPLAYENNNDRQICINNRKYIFIHIIFTCGLGFIARGKILVTK